MIYTNIHRLNTTLHRFCLDMDKGDDPLLLFAFANMMIMEEVKTMEQQIETDLLKTMAANEGKSRKLKQNMGQHERDYNDLYEDQQILTEQIMMALNINKNLIH